MVFASSPVLSERRLAARPVGAHSAIERLFAKRIFSSELTRVVLPTPGPPVMTRMLETNAVRRASFWLSASPNLVRVSAQGMALSASIDGQGGVLLASALSFSAISRSDL